MMGAEMVLSKTALAAPTLHKLLDYQDEDTKEGDFEVGGGFEGNTRSRVWEGGGTCSTNWSSCVGNNVQHGGLCRLTIYAVLCNCHVPPPSRCRCRCLQSCSWRCCRPASDATCCAHCP